MLKSTKTMIRNIFVVVIAIFILLLITGRFGNKEPIFLYRSSFNPSTVNEVEAYMRQVALKWEFELYEKNKKEIEFVTDGQESFFIAFYYKGEYILDVSNVGVGTALTLAVFDYGVMSLSQLEKLTN